MLIRKPLRAQSLVTWSVLNLPLRDGISQALRTVPTVVIAHTFCAPRDTRVSYGWCLLIQGYFCAVQNYPEKAERSKCSWHVKRKLGVTLQFSEIIKLQFGKERHTLLSTFKSFYIVDKLSLKNAWLP